jgi:RNA polymerase sigma-70 factor (ECF subfamily)
MANTELKDMVKNLQDGNIGYFDPIYYETKNVVYYTILGILKDPNISEDIMQETYIKMLEKIHSYKPTSNFKSWLITIARNLAINEFNKRKREYNVNETENEVIFGSVESNSEKELIVMELLNILKDEEKQIVIMHVLGDLKHREIAKMLGKPIGTVTWAYNEAIKKLKSEYESR